MTPAAGLPLELRGLRVEAPGRVPILALDHLACAAGTLIAITGPSGSGKTTLLHCLAGILRPQDGRIAWGGTELGELRGAARDGWRRRHLGFVFQDAQLVPELCLLGNVLLPARFTRLRIEPALRARALELLDRVGLAEPRRRTALLSRGEQQRAAVARALLLKPAVILADEPTASLDRTSAARVGDLLLEVARESGATLVAATHDPDLAARFETAWPLRPPAKTPPEAAGLPPQAAGLPPQAAGLPPQAAGMPPRAAGRAA